MVESFIYWKCNSSIFTSLSFCLSLSSPGPADREEWDGGKHSEDHGFRIGARVAEDHQDEHSGDLRLDGTGGHQILHLLQGQRRVEVSEIADYFPATAHPVMFYSILNRHVTIYIV